MKKFVKAFLTKTPGQKNFPLTYYYNLNRAKWPGAEPGNKKSNYLQIRFHHLEM